MATRKATQIEDALGNLYDVKDAEAREDITELKSAINTIEDALIAEIRTPMATIADVNNYRASETHSGYYEIYNGAKVVRYEVTAGEVLYVTAPANMQFQTDKVIKLYGEGASTIVGDRYYSGYTGYITVPSTAKYLLMDYTSGATPNPAYVVTPTDRFNMLIAGAFDTGTTYKSGQYVIYGEDNLLYRFTSDHAAGAWDATETERVTVCEDLETIRNSIDSVASLNRFDGKFVPGYYINASGTPTAYASSEYTSLIPVEVGENGVSFTISSTAGNDYYVRIHGYDSSEDWVSQITAIQYSRNTTGKQDIKINIESGTAYIRISFYYASVINNLVVTKYDGVFGETAVDRVARMRLDEIEPQVLSIVPKRFSALKSWGTQPAANGTSGSFCDMTSGYSQLLTDVYEPLRAEYPDYITRENVGKDASGTYDMYVYTFAPRYYQQSILLVAGIHADEPDAIASLARIMQLICTEYENDEDLKFIRQNVKVTVIPCVNVWGFSQSPKVRTNSSGSSLQTWNAATPIAEVGNLRPVILALKDELSFLLDMHTTTSNNYLDFYGVINVHGKNVRSIFRTNSWLCENYALNGGTVDDQWLGYLDNMPGLMSNYFFNVHGMTTSTLELSDNRWDSAKSTSTTITMGVTMWMNYIMQQINDFYITMHDIPDSDYRPSKA